MISSHKSPEMPEESVPLNLAIVGGGRTCEFFLQFLENTPLPFISPKIVCVCDIDPDAPGIKRARALGIPTTKHIQDLFEIQGLQGVIELTNNEEVLLELLHRRPRGLWVLEHSIGRLLKSLFSTTQTRKFPREQTDLNREMSEILLHQTRDPILLLDPSFTVVDANDGYLAAIGRSRGAAIGRKCFELIYGFTSPCYQWQPELKCPMLETLQTGKMAKVIHEQKKRDGQRRYCNLETYPIKNDENRVIRVVEILREITQELPSRWENRLRELQTDLGNVVKEDRMLTLGKLSASCAHEINNPIQGLLTFGSLMQSILAREKPTPDDLNEFKGYLDLMCSELERCGKIVSGLLSFARQSTTDTRLVDLNEVLESVITLTRHHMELQDINLELKLTPQSLDVNGDLNQLQQCFLNLVFNAIDASTKGGTITVSSKAEPESNRAEAMVRDTGCGIPEENMDNIFDPFFTTKSQGQGTGLGLSIVYGIVRGHGGEIEVESEPDQGSTFHIWFPLTQEDNAG
ncbi:MAG: PAS domain-containing protein [Deltaproteobacteria bacterium]|nr:PAS domain-containing protein [Deltaproteobacteria bacterium]